MDIIEFLQQSCGKWFSQRTNYDLTGKQLQNGKSDLVIEMLANDSPDVIQLCEQNHLDPILVSGGVRAKWDGIIDRDVKKNSGLTLLVLLADPERSTEGRFLQHPPVSENGTAIGRYVLGHDDVLTLTIETDRFCAEERIWYASQNLRLRTSTVKQTDGSCSASFHSEIRMGSSPPPAS